MNENSSSSSEVGGNIISPTLKKKFQVSPAIKWCFTLNNFTEMDCSSIVLVLVDKCKVAICGREVGESGTPHLQGYCEFKTKVRPVGMFHTDRIFWTKAKGTKEDNDKYCSKDGNLIIRIGYPRAIKIITELRKWQQRILDIYMQEPDDRTVYWFWEEPGDIGKSVFIKYMAVKHSICFCSGGRHTDIMNLVFNTDMDNVKCVMFDIPRANEGHISYSSLEAIKNGMVCNTKYETGFKVFNSPHLFVFANFPPDNMKMLSKDRWCVVEL